MAEHVPERLLPFYFGHAFNLVKPGGVFVHHAIARSVTVPLRSGPSFMDHYVFPDTELVPIHITLRVAEASGWEVRDVENLREHYALTLRCWLERFRSSRREIERLTDEKTFRKFQIYLAGSAHDFECGRLNIFQTILVRPTGHGSGLPLTRAGLTTEKV
jgi:cyclopropane-fatty-acyl-phospholipid synthase